jgi:hypothetical protein
MPEPIVQRTSTRLAAASTTSTSYAADDSRERIGVLSTGTSPLNSLRNRRPSAGLRLESCTTPVSGRGGATAADDDNAVASPLNATAVATLASTIVPFDHIQLAATRKTAAGRSGTLHRLVCTSDVASAYSSLHAVERLHAADIAEPVVLWIKYLSHAPNTVHWPDAGGGSPALRRDLEVRLRLHGVHRVTELAASDGPDAGASTAPSVPSPCDRAARAAANSSDASGLRRRSRRRSSTAAPRVLATTDEKRIDFQHIEDLLDAWMAAHDTNDWSKVLVDVTLELNRRRLSALGGRTPKEVAFTSQISAATAPSTS